MGAEGWRVEREGGFYTSGRRCQVRVWGIVELGWVDESEAGLAEGVEGESWGDLLYQSLGEEGRGNL